MLTNRCNYDFSKYLKEHRFPQRSIEFDSDYYKDDTRELVYSVESEVDKAGLTFAPFFAEVIDRLEIDLGLYLSIFLIPGGYRYRIYDPDLNVEIVSDPINTGLSDEAYDQCIRKALRYYYEEDD